MMKVNGVHALPVVNSVGKPVGMITTTDLLMEVAPSVPVSRLMTPRMISIAHNRDISAAAKRMRDLKFHHLVVTQNGKVTGMLSAFDLLAAIESKESAAAGTKQLVATSTRTRGRRARPRSTEHK